MHSRGRTVLANKASAWAGALSSLKPPSTAARTVAALIAQHCALVGVSDQVIVDINGLGHQSTGQLKNGDMYADMNDRLRDYVRGVFGGGRILMC